MSDPYPPSPGVPGRVAALPLSVLLAVAEAAWLALVWKLQAGAPVWLAGHAALLGAAVLLVVTRSAPGQDIAPHILVLLGTLVLGPLGALLAGVAILAERSARIDTSLLDAWYRRIALAGDIDRVTGIATAVAMGRSVKTGTGPPPDFERIIKEGTTAERQTALGLIARQFAPEYAPALKSALVSPEPVIRVQAAAVAVKVKADLSEVLSVLADTSAPCDPPKAAEAAAELDAMVRTGLLDDEDRARAAAAIATFTRVAMAGFDVRAFRSASPAARAAVETELLRHNRFAEFRALRALEAE